MLSFSAEFPVDRNRKSEEFLDVVKAWILGSPHTQFSSTDFAGHSSCGEWSIQRKNESFHALFVGSLTNQSSAIRWVLSDGGINWETSAVFSRDAFGVWIGVRTSRESTVPVKSLPPAKKPIIVRKLLQSLGGGSDGELSVRDTAIRLGNNDIALAARIILGGAHCHLPVVYVSCDFQGEYVVDPDRLAHDLSGMAHVVSEPNRPFSRRLQIEVTSENVYGGTVGIYWPNGGGRKSFFIGSEFGTARSIIRGVLDEIRNALLNRRPLVRCTWSSVQEIASKEAYKVLRESGSQQVEKYIEVFDAELKAKNEQLAFADREIGRLNAEIRKYEARASVGAGVRVSAEPERDLFSNEIKGIVRDALQDAVGRVPHDSRRSHVLTAFLNSMPAIESAREMKENLKELLRDYRAMTKDVRSGLQNMGFSIQADGKHYKIVFQGDDRYTFTLPKSGSDHRGGLNAASDISKRLF